MFVVQDKLPSHPGRRRIEKAKRADARRTRLAGRTEPKDWQEVHNPTEPFMVRLTGSKKTSIARRRKHDARLWDALTAEHEQAAYAIVEQFEIITTGTTIKVQQFERIGGGPAPYRNPTEAEEAAKKAYFAWASEVQKAHRSHAAVIDILILGESCRSVDKSRRKRKGWAMDNLTECLNIYCRLKQKRTKSIDNPGSLSH